MAAKRKIANVLRDVKTQAKKVRKDTLTIRDLEFWVTSWIGDYFEDGIINGDLGEIIKKWLLSKQYSVKEIQKLQHAVISEIRDTMEVVKSQIYHDIDNRIEKHEKILESRLIQERALKNQFERMEKAYSADEAAQQKEYIKTQEQKTNSYKKALNVLKEQTPQQRTNTAIDEIERLSKEILQNNKELEKRTGIKGFSPGDEHIGNIKNALKSYLNRQKTTLKDRRVLQGKGLTDIPNIAGRLGEKHGRIIKRLLGGSRLEDRHEKLIDSLIANFEKTLPSGMSGKEQKNKLKSFEKDVRKATTKKSSYWGGYLGNKELNEIKQEFGGSKEDEKPVADIKEVEKPVADIKEVEKPVADIKEVKTKEAESKKSDINSDLPHEDDIWAYSANQGLTDFMDIVRNPLGAKDQTEERMLFNAVIRTDESVKKLSDNFFKKFNWEKEKYEDLQSKTTNSKTKDKEKTTSIIKDVREDVDPEDDSSGSITKTVLALLAAKKVAGAISSLVSGVTIGGVATVGVLATAGMAAYESHKKLLEHQEKSDKTQKTFADSYGYDFDRFEGLKETEQRDVLQAMKLGEKVKAYAHTAEKAKKSGDEKKEKEAKTKVNNAMINFKNFYNKMYGDNKVAANLAYETIHTKLASKDNVDLDKTFIKTKSGEKKYTNEQQTKRRKRKNAYVEKQNKKIEEEEQTKRILSVSPGIKKWKNEGNNEALYEKLGSKEKDAWVDTLVESLRTDYLGDGGAIPDIKDWYEYRYDKKLEDAIIQNNTITPFRKDDIVTISTDPGDTKGQNRLAITIEKAFEKMSQKTQGLFNPTDVKDNSLMFFEKVIEPIQEKIAERKQEKEMAIHQQTIITPNKEETITKEIIKPVEPDFVRY